MPESAPETQRPIPPDSESLARGAFLSRVAGAAGGLLGISAATALLRPATARGATGAEGEMLNGLLALEFVSRSFYEQGLQRVRPPAVIGDLFARIAAEEAEHAAVLRLTIEDLGVVPEDPPPARFGAALAGIDSMLAAAQELEQLSLAAYNGAGEEIDSKELLATVASIGQVEARHSASVRLQRGEPFSPGAFATSIGSAGLAAALASFPRPL